MFSSGLKSNSLWTCLGNQKGGRWSFWGPFLPGLQAHPQSESIDFWMVPGFTSCFSSLRPLPSHAPHHSVFQTPAKSSVFQGLIHALFFTSSALPYLHLPLPASFPSSHLLHGVFSDCSNLPDSSPFTIPIVLCFTFHEFTAYCGGERSSPLPSRFFLLI